MKLAHIVCIAIGMVIVSIASSVTLWDVPNEAAQGMIKSVINSNNVTIAAAVTALEGYNVAQTATNDILAVALNKVPRFIGDTLINTASNFVYKAKGVTTNDWIILN